MRTVLLMTLLLVAGCVGRRMDAWIGRPGDELVARWGAPDSHIERRDGSRVLMWSEGWLDTQSHVCRKSVTLARDGRIRSWSVSDCHVWTAVPSPPGG